MSATNAGKRINRQAHLRWIPVSKMKVSPLAQRELKPARVDYIAANFDPDQLDAPTVNQRDEGEAWYIINGQHRVAAIKQIGWGDQQIQCWAYQGLTEAEEAEIFLKLNDTLAVSAFAKFRVAVHAGRNEENDIDRVVRAQGLSVSKNKTDGAVSAVGTLRKVYRRSGPKTLGRTLRLVRDAYGDAGMTVPVIDGLGLLCHRYNGELDDRQAVERLSKIHGGVSGLLGKAEVLRRQTGNQKAHCVAAAAVSIINSGRGGKNLPSWWREEQ